MTAEQIRLMKTSRLILLMNPDVLARELYGYDLARVPGPYEAERAMLAVLELVQGEIDRRIPV